MSTRYRTVLVATLVLSLGASLAEAGRRNRAAALRSGFVAHPNDLKFEPLTYDVPLAANHRHVLSNGVVVYVVPDHGLPLVDVDVTARGGGYLDPPGLEGLAEAMANQMRDGGAGNLDPEAFDEEVDFLALNLGFGAGDRESSASLNVLSHALDEGLDLLFAAMQAPRFDADRLDLFKKRVGQTLERRNDATPAIATREWGRLLYGADHYENRIMTADSLAGLSRDSMLKLHAKIWAPANLMFAVSGDVDAETILAKLEQRMKGWAPGKRVPEPPKAQVVANPAVYVVNKDDVNQTRVRVGHRSVTWDDPDARSLEVMNRVLGGGAFTSRITKRVRSDEGLAYSAGSVFGMGRDEPRSFVSYFQSKNMSVAHAISIVMEEIERIQAEPITGEELETAIGYYIESFPSRFNSASTKAGTFAEDELWGRPGDYWAKYRDEMKAVTAADVQRVAKKHLDPSKLTIMVVGKIDEVVAGDPDHPEYRLENFVRDGQILEIPLPDPASMVYPHEPRPLIGEPVMEGSGSRSVN